MCRKAITHSLLCRHVETRIISVCDKEDEVCEATTAQNYVSQKRQYCADCVSKFKETREWLMQNAAEKRKRHLELEKGRSGLLTSMETLSNADTDANGAVEQETTGVTRWQSIKRAFTWDISGHTAIENDTNKDREQQEKRKSNGV